MDRRLIALSALVALVLPLSAGAQINYPDFTDATGLTLNGSSTIAGPVLRLTPSEDFKTGTAFVTAPVTLGTDGSFSTSFSFRMHTNGGAADGDGAGGAGIAFLIQRDGPTALADTLMTGYGAYGNEFRPNSFTVKFDTFYNGNTMRPQNDVSGNFVGLSLNGSYDSVAQTNYPTRFNDGATFYAWIDFDGSADSLEVRVAETAVRPLTPVLVHSFNLLGVLGGTEAWVGFGAFTGSAVSTHDVENWWFSSSNDSVSQITRLALSRDNVAGCKTLSGTVILSAPAPAGGLAITVSETLASASAPATLRLKKGATSGSFTISTTPVSVGEDGTVSATLGDRTLSQGLTVRPIGVGSVGLKPSKVVGGKTVSGTASLECRAAQGPILVELSSSMPEVATPSTPSILAPVGTQTVSFQVLTTPVAGTVTPSISATANGVSASKALTVSP